MSLHNTYEEEQSTFAHNPFLDFNLILRNFHYRDFAYVARDRLTRIHMCHVFRCDTAARTIANTLRFVYRKIV